MISIKENIVVFFRYIMRNSKSEEVENIMAGPSKSYLHGSSNIQLSLQEQFEGLQAGDKKDIYLKMDDSQSTDYYLFEIVVDHLRPASAEEILLGYPVVVIDSICNEHCNC